MTELRAAAVVDLFLTGIVKEYAPATLENIYVRKRNGNRKLEVAF